MLETRPSTTWRMLQHMQRYNIIFFMHTALLTIFLCYNKTNEKLLHVRFKYIYFGFKLQYIFSTRTIQTIQQEHTIFVSIFLLVKIETYEFILASCEPLDKLTPFLTHGEVFVPKRCHSCECNDGHVECSRVDPEKDCPELSCPSNQRIVEEGKCCPICRGKCLPIRKSYQNKIPS